MYTWGAYWDHYCSEELADVLLLLRGVRANVLEGAQDVRWDWGRSGQIPAGGPVTVLVGSPAQLVQLSLGVVVVRLTVGHVAPESRLSVCDSVGGLEVVGVRAIEVHLRVLVGDVRVTVDVGGRSQGQDGGENELKMRERDGSYYSLSHCNPGVVSCGWNRRPTSLTIVVVCALGW